MFQLINVQQDINSGPWTVDVAPESDTEGSSTYCDVLDCLDVHAARVYLAVHHSDGQSSDVCVVACEEGIFEAIQERVGRHHE